MLVPKERPTELSADIQIREGVTPPTFLAMAQDDPVGVENPLFYYLGLKQANVSLHDAKSGADLLDVAALLWAMAQEIGHLLIGTTAAVSSPGRL